MTKIDIPRYKQRFSYHNEQLQVTSSHLLSNGLKLDPHEIADMNNNVFAMMSIDNELMDLRNLLDSYRDLLVSFEQDCNEMTGRIAQK